MIHAHDDNECNQVPEEAHDPSADQVEAQLAADNPFLAMAKAFPGLLGRDGLDGKVERIARDVQELVSGFAQVVHALEDRREWDPDAHDVTEPSEPYERSLKELAMDRLKFPNSVQFLDFSFHDGIEDLQRHFTKANDGFKEHLGTFLASLDDSTAMRARMMREQMEERFERLHREMDVGFAQLRQELHASRVDAGTPVGCTAST